MRGMEPGCLPEPKANPRRDEMAPAELKLLFPKAKFWPPANSETIAAAEAALRLTLPGPLRALYHECNGLREDKGNAKYLLSLLEEDHVGSLVTITKSFWSEFKVPNLKPFVFFGVSGGDEAWGINVQEPEQIIAYHHHMENEYQVVGTNIVDVWMADYLRYEPA
jgi:hypothetical protein